MSIQKGRVLCKRLLSVVMAAALSFELCGSALAYVVTGENTAPPSVSITDASGNTQQVDESWEDTFPYGAFAFEQSGLALSEGEKGTIKVYRLGGTAGRATAYITYEPVVVQDENGDAEYSYAVSARDVDIRVEEPLPRAMYDPVGRPPAPEAGKARVKAVPDELGYTLQLSEEAEAYRWQIGRNGVFEDIVDASGAEVPADAEFIDNESYDYRCVYTVKGVEYCSASLRGAVYEKPAEEQLPERPADMDLNAKPEYTALDLRGKGEDPYNGWAFELIFADGEWVKEIHLDALTDELPEAQEAAAFTIRDCEGGEVLESANTLLFRIEDINAPEPSTLGFTVSDVTVDKADGTAEVMIERVGGAQRPVSVEYTTIDGTALAGTDYAQTSGKLMFYAGVTRLPVKVELINDGVKSDEPVSFKIVLSELLGDDTCKMTQSKVRVDLINSGKVTEEANLSTQLYDPGAVDLTGAVTESSGAANGGSVAVTGQQVKQKQPGPTYSTLTWDSGRSGDDMSLQVYEPSLAKIDFKNPSSHWTDKADAAQKHLWQVNNGNLACYGENDTATHIGKDPHGSSDVKIDRGVAIASTTDGSAGVPAFAWENEMGAPPEMAGQLFSRYEAEIEARMGHDTSYLHGVEYKYSFTRPHFQFMQGDRELVGSPRSVKRFGSGPLNKSWAIRASDDGSHYSNPFNGTYSGSLDFPGKLNLNMSLWYASYNSHEHDELNDNSMMWLKKMELTRRTFAQDAFRTEISTPNDANTAPKDGTVLSEANYRNNFEPKVEIVNGKGGVNGKNQLYVGSTVKITAGKAPAGYYVSDVVVYQRANEGASWHLFDRFGSGSYNSSDHSYTFKLIGSDGVLDSSDLSSQYKFRVCYSRRGSVTVDFESSIPRVEGSMTEIDTGRINEVIQGYASGNDHAFNYGVPSTVTYGYTVFDRESGDFGTECVEKTISKPTALNRGQKTWSFTDTNIQWVNFNLSPKDLLMVNGVSYPGNARIYLKEADLAGNLSVLYYHEDYQTAQSPMKTAIAWSGLYWDANGNGKIDGYYNETNSSFMLTDTKDGPDEFITYIENGSANETLFAPKKNSKGKLCQYFIKTCYTMTPRSLVVPKGASDSERAQILPAFVTSVNPDSAAYSKLTPEQRAYSYLVSGKTRQSTKAAESRSSDGHIKYGAAANARSTLDIPLGGDFSPPTLPEGASKYVWDPVFRGNMLYPYAAPTPITITNSIAGATEVTTEYKVERDEDDIATGYSYSETGLKRMNGYLSSFTGSTTFALVTQEQRHTTEEILKAVQPGVKLGGGAGGTDDNNMYVQDAEDYSVYPDSVTMSGYATTPDAEYLKQMQDESAPESDVDMDESGSEMSEFNVDLGLNLGSMELAATDYVTILLDETKVGFAIGLPLGEVGGDENVGFVDANKEAAWTKYKEFFKKSNFGGDESYKKASTEHTRKKNADLAAANATNPPNPPPANPYNKSEFQSKSFSVGFAVGLAFMFEYNPLDNGYYFEGMTISIGASLSFRIQARLTVCPIVYFYFQFDGAIELGTGLGVIRDSVEKDPLLDGKSAANHDKQISLTYMNRPSGKAVITQAAYDALGASEKGRYKEADQEGYYYKSSYKSFDAARAVYLETGDYFLTAEQYALLNDTEKADYEWTSGGAYNKKNFSSYRSAAEAYNKAASYTFTTDSKAFNIRFSGKLAVDVYTKQDGRWKPAEEDSGYITGFLNSDGTEDTQVVLKKQDGMELGEQVQVVLRPLEYDEKTSLEKTDISYIAEIRDIRNEVYWKGMSISPSIALEVGAGVGVELLKVELYAKLGLEATFLLGVYNTAYDPYDRDFTNDNKYLPASVDSFGFSIGIGLRVVLLAFTFELDAATYCVDYDGSEWETGWHFLNDWVEADSESGFLGVTIRPPHSTDQKLYAPEDNAEPDMGTQAYDPTDETVPFQLSGYGSSVDAANLSTSVIPGGDYKVVAAGGRDFIVYTVSRTDSGIAGEDVPQLVLSELKRTNTAAEGETPAYKYGLANPTGAASPLYIVLDDDNTGDLDFDVWVEEKNNAANGSTTYTIHSAWVSYASPARVEPTKPEGASYNGMNADNYASMAAPEAPVEAEYYQATETTYDKAQFEELTEAQQALCKKTGLGSWVLYEVTAAGCTTLAEAEAAYAAVQTAYTADLASYNAWHDYYQALDSYNTYQQSRVKNAAQNTVLKSAAWSYTSVPYTGEGEGAPEIRSQKRFSDAAILGGDDAAGTVGYVFAPASNGDGSAVFYGSTLKQDENDAAYERYVRFLESSGMAAAEYGDYLKATRKSMLDVLGVQSNLNLAYRSSDGTAVSSMALAAGQTLGNVEFTQLSDGAYYLAYTTKQDAYRGDDHITVERLFLNKVTVSGDTAEWGRPYLLRMTEDYDNDNTKDGLYSANGTLKESHESPYFANLSFLKANLDSTMLTGVEEEFTLQEVEEHTFLLFEMNGATYLILDDSLESITTTGKGTIHPFFTGLTHDDGAKEASGKLEVTIGTDDTGALYAVYVGSVPNTTNNALYLSAYDPNTNTWGDGVMLAMHSMDTYEAALRYDWGSRTAQAAYFGVAGQNGGLLTETDIANLYGEYAGDVSANLKAYPDALGDSRNLSFSNVQAVRGAEEDLLVITQGTLTELNVVSYEDTNSQAAYTVMPKYTDGGMDSSLGMYAVSYGKGSQQLGEGGISFGTADFGAGSQLYVQLKAVNTGDTAFRGSKEQPITAVLSVDGQQLATWKVESNIRSGQMLTLDGDCAALERDLPNGAEFTLNLKEFEGPDYENPANVSLNLFTVERLPDLGVEDMKASIAGVSADGSKTTLHVEFVAANRGSGKAEGVYAQFAYADGVDENGEPTYAALSLENSDLTVDQAAELKTLAADEENAGLKSGILPIYNATDGNDDLEAGYGRRVSGTIEVDSRVFAAGESGHLNLKVELFAGADRMIGMDAGVINAEHDEYFAGNNVQTADLQAATYYTAAPSVVIPMGTTTLVPVTAVSTRGTQPSISVTEINDTADGQNIGILNFRVNEAENGIVSGMLSITPIKPGTGVIHLYDADTESLAAVAFTVTEAADGIDIFNDNGAFTFRNADGKPYDPNGVNQSWAFNSAPTWGSGADAEVPLRSNLSMGSKNASFSFRTVAESIDLYFQGSIQVTSADIPDYQGGTYTNDRGGAYPTTISLGKNEENAARTVTIRITSATASFDRLKESYAGGVVPKPEYDGTSPMFIWSRSFPATASIPAGGEGIPLSLYVLDNNGVDYLTVNGTRFTAANNAVAVLDEENLLWRYDFGTLSQNENYIIEAVDISGNKVSTILMADWFAPAPSGDENTVAVPEFDAGFRIGADPWNGNPISSGTINELNIGFTEAEDNQKAEGNTHELYFLDAGSFKQLSADEQDASSFKVSTNGIYWARTINSDKTWTAEMLYMGGVDTNLPQVALSFNEEKNTLEWKAYKTGKSPAKITDVAINGFKVNEGTGNNLYGTMEISYGGVYELTAVDAAGNRNSSSFTVKNMPVKLDGCTIETVGAWNQARSNGIARMNLSKASGGLYNAEDSDEAQNLYRARYQAAAVPAEYDMSGLAEDADLVWTAVTAGTGYSAAFENLAAGAYRLVVRDAGDSANIQTMSFSIADDAITLQTASRNASAKRKEDGQVLVTANGGNTTAFEFAIMPAPDYEGEAPTLEDFLALDTPESEVHIVWHAAGDPAVSLRSNVFSGLKEGQYLVAVRGAYGVTQELLDALTAAGGALNEAKAKLKAAEEAAAEDKEGVQKPTEDELEQLRGAVNDAQAVYDIAAKNVENASAGAYQREEQYWDGAKVAAVTVDFDRSFGGAVPQSNLGSMTTDSSGAAVYPIKSLEQKLNLSDSANIVKSNQTSDVILSGNGLTVYIPEGTLGIGADVNRLILDPKKARDGMVVEYTAPDRTKLIVPWCLVSEGDVRYIAVGGGQYALVAGSADFNDIAGLWGADAIEFAARRELFAGTGDGKFSPNLPMSRAMFVTVLWRMENSPDAEEAVTFTDLDADWYQKAVQWAVENGIAAGYSAERFGPNDPVSREQMCVFLCRYLEYKSWTMQPENAGTAFADAEKISTWAGNSVDTCTRAGLIKGVGSNSFAPALSASRMEVSTLLTRFVTKMVEQFCGV